MSSQLRKQAIQLFCCLFFCYAFVHQNMGWNQNSRLDLLHALLIQKSFQIDEYHENTGDKSLHKGHYYSDKAPGIVFLALPAFTTSLGILKLFDIPHDSPRGWRISSWITTVGSVGLITALGGAAMFLFLCRFFNKNNALITTFVTFLGASPFPYATMLFSHAAAAGLISISLWAVSDRLFLERLMNAGDAFPTLLCAKDHRLERRWLVRHLVAGLCCGFAISSEFTAATAAAGVLALASLVRWQRAVVLALGAVPPLLLIPAYNWVCFDSPLSFGYHNLALAEFQEMNKGLFGITFPPKLDAVYLILFSPARGLFFWTPFFILALFFAPRFFNQSRAVSAIGISVILLHAIFMAGYYMPSGGSALGPRHLTVILPFLAIFACMGTSRYPRTALVLGYWSLLLTGIGTLIDAMPPADLANPLSQFYQFRMEQAQFAPTITSFLALDPWVAPAALVCAIIIPYLCSGAALLRTHDKKTTEIQTALIA